MRKLDIGLLPPALAASAIAVFVIAVFLVPSAGAALRVIPPGEPDGFVSETSVTQAGSAADDTVSFNLDPQPVGFLLGPLKDTVVDLPPGLLGNPEAVPKCVTLQTPGSIGPQCPLGSQVGTVDLRIGVAPGVVIPLVSLPLFNMVAPRGVPGDLGFILSGSGTPVHITASLRPGDYGIRTRTRNITQYFAISGVTVHVWGVPADPIHDFQRCTVPNQNGICDGTEPQNSPHASDVPRQQFFTNPTNCTTAPATTIAVSGWEERDVFTSTTAFAPTPTGCNQLDFAPTVEAKPTTNIAGAPSGLDFKLHIPQNEDVDGLSTAHLRDSVVTLPKGMTVNPPSADGLVACSMAQLGISPQGVPNDDPVACPDASKLGSVSAVSPLLPDPVEGAVYLAKQGENPFNSLLALYIALKDDQHGVLVKLAGEVKPDPQTGQLTVFFNGNPQLPVEDLELHLKQGPRAALRTPLTCGTSTTIATLTPWSAPEASEVTLADSFGLVKGPGGGDCIANEAAASNTPSFTAGTVDPTAGVFTPFLLRLARADGSQQVKRIEVTLPPGLVGKLAGIPYCPDPALAAAAAKSGRSEQSSPSCPAASEVGTVNVGAGAGSTPLNVGAKAYLAGPYKGAPLSMAIITPAVAGPFDLGTVVVRAALQVDPTSAQIKAVSDPIPTILQGIPLDLRTISGQLAKPQFTLNPTSCDPMQVTGQVFSVFDQAAALSSPFQVGDCARLGFKPNLRLALKGGTKRNGHPALQSTLTFAKGSGANLKSAVILLPPTEQIDNAHINNPCTRVQFNAEQCPKGSVLGYAKAFSPLLDKPLEGPVYFRSNGGERELPDLVADLNGQIHVVAVGFVDSVKGRLRTTFASVPDAPISKVSVSLAGGKRGLLVNNRDICARDYRLNLTLTAHNGKVSETTPKLRTSCKGKAKKKKRDAKQKKG